MADAGVAALAARMEEIAIQGRRTDTNTRTIDHICQQTRKCDGGTLPEVRIYLREHAITVTSSPCHVQNGLSPRFFDNVRQLGKHHK